MAKLLLLVACISVASALPGRSGKALSDLLASQGKGGHPADHDDGECVDISTYRDVFYKEESFTLQGYMCEKNCVSKTQEVCQNVETTVCELEGYADCKEELVESGILNVDGTEKIEWFPHVCKPLDKVLTTFIEKVECKDKLTWVCDSVWVEGPDGKLTEKQENCREEKHNDCELIRESVDKTYTGYDCQKDTTPISYVRPIYKTKPVNRYSLRCQAKALPTCRPRVERRCTTVTYQECDEEWARTSMDIIQRIPDQEYDHRLKCIYD